MCTYPVATPVTPLTPEIATGVREVEAISPSVSSPQHETVASDRSAHMKSSPAAIAVAPLRPMTATGTGESLYVPSPRTCPSVLCPPALDGAPGEERATVLSARIDCGDAREPGSPATGDVRVWSERAVAELDRILARSPARHGADRCSAQLLIVANGEGGRWPCKSPRDHDRRGLGCHRSGRTRTVSELPELVVAPALDRPPGEHGARVVCARGDGDRAPERGVGPGLRCAPLVRYVDGTVRSLDRRVPNADASSTAPPSSRVEIRSSPSRRGRWRAVRLRSAARGEGSAARGEDHHQSRGGNGP